MNRLILENLLTLNYIRDKTSDTVCDQLHQEYYLQIIQDVPETKL